MAIDLFLATHNSSVTPNFPPQVGNPTYFFGEQSNDLQFDNLNDFATVTGLQKTVQDVQKILLTEQGANIQFPLYGTTLQSSIGEKVNPNIISSQIQDQVVTGLQILFLLTQNDPNPDEVVQTLHSLSIQLNGETSVNALATIIAASGKEITTGININTL